MTPGLSGTAHYMPKYLHDKGMKTKLYERFCMWEMLLYNMDDR